MPNPGHRDDPVIPIIAGQKEPSPRRALIIGKIDNHTASTSARVSLPLSSTVSPSLHRTAKREEELIGEKGVFQL